MKDQVLLYLKGESKGTAGELGDERTCSRELEGEKTCSGALEMEIEKHLEHCEQCQALVEGFLAGEEAIRLPEADWGNANLKESVEHYDIGNKRILVFTIVGLILGWFSYRYYITDFLPLKVILAIPYKVSELLHTALHDHSYIYISESVQGQMDAFFPQSGFASLLAEYGVSSLIGGALYGSIGFFTGDKRIFTLTKFLKFAATWTVIVSVAIGGTFLINQIAVEKNHSFTDVSGFLLHYDHGSDGFYREDTGVRGTLYSELERAFYEDEDIIEIPEQRRDFDGEELIEFYYGSWHTRSMAAWINPEEKYLVNDNGTIYSMNDTFCRLVGEYKEREEREYEQENE
jgi:hypothetical protein